MPTSTPDDVHRSGLHKGRAQSLSHVNASGPIRIHLTSLNRDVLFYILSFLSFPDALSLSKTCRAAYTLSEIDSTLHTVVIDRSVSQVLQFRSFLLAKDSRPRFVKSLAIAKALTWGIDYDHFKEIADALADILETTTDLEHFSCGDMDQMLSESADSRLKHALVDLTTLKQLTLTAGGPEIAEVAASTNSLDLQELSLDCRFVTPIPYKGLLGKLTHLRRLTHVSFSRLYHAISIPPGSMDTFSPILSVHTLVLICTWIPLPLAAKLFPNAKRITFVNARHYLHFDQVPVSEADAGSGWHILEKAHIDAQDLKVWPICSLVRRLDLGVLYGGCSSEALAAVERTRPWVLECSYTIDADNLFWIRLSVVATELRFLDIRILERFRNLRDSMLGHLAGFPALIAAFLCIRTYHQPADAAEEATTLARQLGRLNGKLRFVGIGFSDGRSMREEDPVYDEERLGSRWFELRRKPLTEPSLAGIEAILEVRPISTDVGFRVRDYLHEVDFDTPGWEEQLSAIVG
ncbi:hypothetical protein C8Q77DRAFT_1154452 [Trametes polyzona]|nr:hypothetical protein C8Q77DRAFT_1154452 [Trametes polyzona]